MPELSQEEIGRIIEHTHLRPEATEATIRRTCREARKLNCAAAVINPAWVGIAHEELQDSDLKVVTVAGFPLGASRSEFKMVEAVRGAIDGAREIDMVANVGWLVAGETPRAEHEIADVRKSLPDDILLKVIIEASLLTPQQQADATRAVINAGAQFVKSSTGFFGGATVEQIKVLSETAGDSIGVKASGGIGTIEQCRLLIEAGASRIGTSATLDILT